MAELNIKLTPEQIAAMQEEGVEVIDSKAKAPEPARPLHPAIKRVVTQHVLECAFGTWMRPTYRNRLMACVSFSVISAPRYVTPKCDPPILGKGQ